MAVLYSIDAACFWRYVTTGQAAISALDLCLGSLGEAWVSFRDPNFSLVGCTWMQPR